ncbi:MAG: N-acetylmuramoyl-L-alanine amidase [Cyanobacteria bacterium P01_A01_bin.3]
MARKAQQSKLVLSLWQRFVALGCTAIASLLLVLPLAVRSHPFPNPASPYAPMTHLGVNATDRPSAATVETHTEVNNLPVTVANSENAADPIVYPPNDRVTLSPSIFVIGTAPPSTRVTLNGQDIHRSPAGHFAPSVPLAIGSNPLILSLQSPSGHTQQFVRHVTRRSPVRQPPIAAGILEDTIRPNSEVWQLPGEISCFEAIATPNAEVSLQLWDSRVQLAEQSSATALPAANAILTDTPTAAGTVAQPGLYRACVQLPASKAGTTITPELSVSAGGQVVTKPAAPLKVLDPDRVLVARANTDDAIARNGPSTNYIRYSPWPKGTESRIIGRENDWLHTASDRWITSEEVDIETVAEPPSSAIGSTQLVRVGEWTELRLPMTVRLPYNVVEEPGQIVLDVDGAVLQTDFFKLTPDNPLVEDVSWSQISPDRVRYILHLTQDYAWGYDINYEGTTLLLRVRHTPEVDASAPLRGLTVAIDPGHGGSLDLGTRGPTGMPEKDLVLTVSQRLKSVLERQGASVLMTRTEDVFVPLADRADLQAEQKPHLFVSLHYNALPDSGNAETTSGIGSFWYFPHSRELAESLHLDLVNQLGQADYGHFFSSLAVIRATTCPSVLLELGFAIHPEEFELISSPNHQQQTAEAIAQSLQNYVAGAA